MMIMFDESTTFQTNNGKGIGIHLKEITNMSDGDDDGHL